MAQLASITHAAKAASSIDAAFELLETMRLEDARHLQMVLLSRFGEQRPIGNVLNEAVLEGIDRGRLAVGFIEKFIRLQTVETPLQRFLR